MVNSVWPFLTSSPTLANRLDDFALIGSEDLDQSCSSLKSMLPTADLLDRKNVLADAVNLDRRHLLFVEFHTQRTGSRGGLRRIGCRGACWSCPRARPVKPGVVPTTGTTKQPVARDKAQQCDAERRAQGHGLVRHRRTRHERQRGNGAPPNLL